MKGIKITENWKTVRVFISSTFKDMQAERDHLVRFVFPRLREDLIKYRIHLVDVDLRWGVTSDQDAYEVCMEEIDNCHPRFICMLGGRYGWIPQKSNISITASEIHYGALDKLNEPVFRYFYFRNPEITNFIPDKFAEEYREPKDSESEYLLESLKERIMDPQTKGKTLVKPDKIECKSLPHYVYPCRWDKTLNRIVDLESFGNHVYIDIMQSIWAEFGKETIESLNEFGEEKAATEAFIEQKIENYVVGSRREIIDSLKNFIGSNMDNGYLCLYGEPGSGKTALMAKFCQEYAINQPDKLIIPFFIGSTIKSSDPRQILRRLCYELSKISDYTGEIPEDYEELKRNFNSLLVQASKIRSVIILIDAVNQLNQADNLRWLPDKLPKNVHILISTIPGPVLDLLRNRRISPEEAYVSPLESSDSEIIIDEFLNRYRKRLDEQQKTALISKDDSNNPLYLATALEELRTLGTYGEITDRILELPETVQPLFQWILKRLEQDQGFRDSNGELVGPKIVQNFVSLTAVSRYGLSQKELSDLIVPGDPEGNVAAFQRLLRPYLMFKGDLISFYHGQLLEAVNNLYLVDDGVKSGFHLKLANYFESSSLDRKVEELPWQLYHANELDRLKNSIIKMNMFKEMMIRGKEYELTGYWRVLNRYDMVEEYFTSLGDYSKSEATDEDLSFCLYYLAKFLEINSKLDNAETLYKRAITLREKIYGKDHPYTASMLNNLALLLMNKGDYNGAEPLLERAISINKNKLGDEHPFTIKNIANLASVLNHKKDFDNAEKLYLKALEIEKEEYGPEHPNVATTLNNLADVAYSKGNIDKSKKFYRQALEISEKSLGQGHPSTAQILTNFATLLNNIGENEVAEKYFRQALDICEEVLGPDNIQTTTCMNNLAKLLYDKENYDEAESLFKFVLNSKKQTQGLEHLDTILCMNNLGMTLYKKGDYDSANETLVNALTLIENNFGPDHPLAIGFFNNIMEVESARNARQNDDMDHDDHVLRSSSSKTEESTSSFGKSKTFNFLKSQLKENAINSKIPPTDNKYIDSCFQIKCEEKDDDRVWSSIEDIKSLPDTFYSGNHQNALEIVEKAIKKYPDFYFLYSWKGLIKKELGYQNEPSMSYIEGLDKSKTKYALCCDMGDYEFELSHLDEAVKWWIRSCVLQIKYNKVTHSNPFLSLAYVIGAAGLENYHDILIKYHDRIRAGQVRFNNEMTYKILYLTRQQANEDIKRAIENLCLYYID